MLGGRWRVKCVGWKVEVEGEVCWVEGGGGG